MGQKLTDEQVSSVLNEGPFGLYVRYPWAEWTDGSWWKIVKGEDYRQETDSMRRTIALHAQRHSMKAELHKRGDVLVFKFTDNG